jgi:hypothetical protein
MTDGLRWQEVFSGAEAILMTKENGGVSDAEGLTQVRHDALDFGDFEQSPACK